MERLLDLRIATLCAITLSLTVAGAAHAGPRTTKSKVSKVRSTAKSAAPAAVATTEKAPLPWCAEEFETLPNGLCHIDGGQKEGRRTLVVFLHGAIAKGVDWQWLQERALARQAKQSKFEAIFARAPLGPKGYVWPGTASAQEASEQELVEGWDAARTFLEKRSGEAYDDVFLMGFSSGAYYVSSLVARGRVKFDGYATFAGGGGWHSGADVPFKAPVYVGVCARDRQTAAHSRAFGAHLATRGWPHRVDEQKVGHMFSDIHVAHAVSYLRSAKKPRPE